MAKNIGLAPTCVTCIVSPIASPTPGSAATERQAASDTVLNERSAAPFWTTMKLAPPVWMI